MPFSHIRIPHIFPTISLPGFLLALLLGSTLPTGELQAWQQRVRYAMNIELSADAHSYRGTQRLVYINNSPDTLREVFYHLYYEAFKPGSLMDLRDRSMPDGGSLDIGALPPEDQGEVRVASLAQNGRPISWKINETVLRASLSAALPPGDSTVLDMSWTTRIPRLRRRGGWMSSEGVEYSMSQWYPKLAAYDAAGWHADPYVGREFYGVFGTFDVSITLPATYVVGSTGVVTNPADVRCGYDLGSVDTLVLFPASGTGTKTWKFHAENVHDFAWVADREYAHQIVMWGNVPIHLLFKRDYYGLWRNLGEQTRRTLEYFSRRFGVYSWPQFTVAMAGDGGMEYPHLIMITGRRSANSLARVTAHELGHQWYYGMIANNETQEAWMDEGFTQYLTEEARRNVLRIDMTNPYTGIDAAVYHWDNSPWRDIELYYTLAESDYDEPLITFHDWLREGATAGLVYYKGEAVVRMLQNMLGDSLFDAGMRLYLQRWRYRHPGYRDYEKVMEDVSGMPLDWFFNQWIGLKKTCDYAMESLASESIDGAWRTTMKLANRDEIVMPLDLTLIYDDGSTAVANIPVEDWRKPDVDFNLPQWKWMERSYSATFSTPRRVVRAVIDTSMLLLDMDRTNNSAASSFPANLLPWSHVAFYKRWDENRPVDRYSIRLRPTLWYSQADGVQPGFTADGGYTFNRYNAKLGVAYNLKSQRIDYDIRYDTPLDLLGRNARIATLATNADGVQRWGVTVSKTFPTYFYQEARTTSIALQIEREELVGPNYPNDVAPWEEGAYNTLGLTFEQTLLRSRSANIATEVGFDASFASRQEFTQWQLQAKGAWSMLGLGWTGEIFGGASLGEPPPQRLFNTAGATSRDMHLNQIHRLAMNAHPEFAARNHLLLPTQGFLVSLIEADSGTRFGRNLLNGRFSIDGLNPFQWLYRLPYLSEIDLGVYAAGGWIFRDKVTFDAFSDFNGELGAYASVDLLPLLFSSTIVDAIDSPTPVRLSLYIPFYAHSPLLRESGAAFRWGVGVSM